MKLTKISEQEYNAKMERLQLNTKNAFSCVQFAKTKTAKHNAWQLYNDAHSEELEFLWSHTI